MKVVAFIALVALAHAKYLPPNGDSFSDFKMPDGKFEGVDNTDYTNMGDQGFNMGETESNPFGIDMNELMTKMAGLTQKYQDELRAVEPETRCELCNNALAYTSFGMSMLHLTKSDIEKHIREKCKSVKNPGDVCERAINNIDYFNRMAAMGGDSTAMCAKIGVLNCQPPEPTETQKKIGDIVSGMLTPQ